mgnify:CR=1 FL=1
MQRGRRLHTAPRTALPGGKRSVLTLCTSPQHSGGVCSLLLIGRSSRTAARRAVINVDVPSTAVRVLTCGESAGRHVDEPGWPAGGEPGDAGHAQFQPYVRGRHGHGFPSAARLPGRTLTSCEATCEHLVGQAWHHTLDEAAERAAAGAGTPEP